MTEPKTYPHGVPSWVDTVAHDLDGAKRFYAGLFDWTFTDAMPAEAPGHYLIATIGGEDVAAIASPDSDDEAVDVAHLHRRRRRRRHRQGRRGGGRHRDRRSRRRGPRRTPGGVRRSPRRRVPAVAGPQASRRAARQRAGVVELQRPPDHRSPRRRGVLLTDLRLGGRRRRIRDDGPQARLRRPPRRDRRPRHPGAPGRRRGACRFRGHRRVDAHRRGGPRRSSGRCPSPWPTATRPRPRPRISGAPSPDPTIRSGRGRRRSATRSGREFVLSQFTPPKG